MYTKTSQEFFKSFLEKSFLRVSWVRKLLKNVSGNAQETFQETIKKRPGNVPETCRKRLGNAAAFCQGVEATQETFRKRLGNVLETLRKRSGNVVETLKKRPRKLLKNVSGNVLETFFQETLKKRLGSFLVQLSICIYPYIMRIIYTVNNDIYIYIYESLSTFLCLVL